MGMEVVWIRLYTPYLGTVVYAFAGILATYLLATFLGSLWYRRRGARALERSAILWAVLGAAALLPLAAADPRMSGGFWLTTVVRLAAGILPFTILAGFLTPMLVDRVSGGDPRRAGSAYALNVVGCILGPLVAGFMLLPWAGERWALGMLATVWLMGGAYFAFRPSAPAQPASQSGRQWAFAASVAMSAALLGVTHDFASQFPDNDKMVRRDATATVIATGLGERKQLRVNGVGMTIITPITKFMAHFPMALLDRPPQHVLDICFGMGTTYRSMLSWGVPTDAAELVPSVPAVFSFFHADAPQVLGSPLGRIYVDDGRMHLERTREIYDVITIDPPPPISAAGSSLLYSKEFYTTAKRRLRPGGIVAQWVPGGDAADRVAVTRAIGESFRYVRVFVSVKGWGLHLLASDSPLPNRSARDLAARLPASAQADFVEWGPYHTPEAQFAALLNNEIDVANILRLAPSAAAITDDHPINEYYLWRALSR
jgi:spermidine synthase